MLPRRVRRRANPLGVPIPREEGAPNEPLLINKYFYLDDQLMYIDDTYNHLDETKKYKPEHMELVKLCLS